MFKTGDFHIHTNASDGKLSPADVVILASNVNLDIISITDHDTTEGLAEAIETSMNYNIKVIPGIELSTIHNNESIHILGYFRDNSYGKNEFQAFLSEMKNYRIIRAKKMINNLKKYFNIGLDFDKIYSNSHGIIARPHIAKAIIKCGYDYSWDYIFDNIISKDSPAYVPNKKLSIPEGINLLKEFNAVTVLAHPVLMKKSKIEDLMKFDFDGIEAIYPLNSKNETVKYIEIANSHKKIITAGSDFHGEGRIDTKHGELGSINLDSKRIKILLKKLNIH